MVQPALRGGAAARRAGIPVLRQGAGVRPRAADGFAAGRKGRGKRPASRPHRAGVSADRRADPARHGPRDRGRARRRAGGLARPAARAAARQVPPAGRGGRAFRHSPSEKQGRSGRGTPPHGVRGAVSAVLRPSAAQGAPTAASASTAAGWTNFSPRSRFLRPAHSAAPSGKSPPTAPPDGR